MISDARQATGTAAPVLVITLLAWMAAFEFRPLYDEAAAFSIVATSWWVDASLGLALGWLAAAAASSLFSRDAPILHAALGWTGAAILLAAIGVASSHWAGTDHGGAVSIRIALALVGAGLWPVTRHQVTGVLGAAAGAIPVPALLLGLGMVIIFLPTPPQESLGGGAAPVTGLGAYLAATPDRLYYLFKQLMLWLPLGFVLAAARGEALARTWSLAATGTYGLVALGYGAGLQPHELAGAAIIPIAVWSGAWLGARTRTSLTAAHPTERAAEGHAATASSPSIEPPNSVMNATSSPREVAHRPAARVDEPPMVAWGRRALALAAVVAVLLWALDFPRWPWWLVGGLATYAVILLRWPHFWLLVVPASIPLLDLAPWTGRFFFDELDMVLAMTVAMAIWHGRHPNVHGARRPRQRDERPPRPGTFPLPEGEGEVGPRPPRVFTVLLLLYAVAYAISLARGLWPLSPLDANAFASYWSHWNALRVGKGLLWALVVMLLIRSRVPRDYGPTLGLFVVGSWVGVVGLVALTLRERWLYADLTDLDATYRVTGSFSSMHTGGNHIEAYLVLTIPLLWLGITRARHAIIKAGGVLVALAAIYTTLMTIARAGIAAVAVGLTVLAVGAWRSFTQARGPGRRLPYWQGLALAAAVGLLIFGSTSGALRDRFAQVWPDLQTRVSHWQLALDMAGDDMVSTLFGEGIGRFPEAYLFRATTDSERGVPTTYRIVQEGDDPFLRMAAGETVYVVQRVDVEPATDYVLHLRLRAEDGHASLDLPLCEKHLLSSHRCEWQGVRAPADGQWHERSVHFNSGAIGGDWWLSQPPVDLQLYVPERGTVVDVDDIRLSGPDGQNLLLNGDFSAGMDGWFPRAHTHLPFHIKNQFVSLVFEQGWTGLVLFTLLTGFVLLRLVRAAWRGHAPSSVALASLAGFLVACLFGSPFDAPRLTLLFFVHLFLGALVSGPIGGTSLKNDSAPQRPGEPPADA